MLFHTDTHTHTLAERLLSVQDMYTPVFKDKDKSQGDFLRGMANFAISQLRWEKVGHWIVFPFKRLGVANLPLHWLN